MSVPSVLLLFVAVAGGASVRPAPPQPPPGIACSASSNVTCPANSFGCVPSHYELKFACNMSSGAPGHPFTTCSPGAPHPLSTTKANVLIIGDSVSNGYMLEATPGTNVPDLLADVALVQHAPWSPGSGGAGPTQHGIDCLEVYLRLATGQAVSYDVITFNFGLHDLGNTTSEVETYAEQLANITGRLLETGAKVQYHLTTPMMPKCCKGAALLPSGEGAPPPGCNASSPWIYPCDDVVLRLNTAAQQIMAAHHVPVVDLYGTVTAQCGAHYVNCSICRMEPCSYHYTPSGYTMIAKPIAASIRTLLGQPRLGKTPGL